MVKLFEILTDIAFSINVSFQLFFISIPFSLPKNKITDGFCNCDYILKKVSKQKG